MKETTTLERTKVNEITEESKRCVVLLSGGIDSTVLMYSLVADFEVWPLTISYGQRHNKEVLAARNVCEARDHNLLLRWKYVDLSVLRTLLPSALTGVGEVPEGRYDEPSMKQTVVPGRNLILLSIAAGYAEGIGAGYVAYAAHSEDHFIYPDCRPEFVQGASMAIHRSTDFEVNLIAPFINKTKADIVALGKKLNVPFWKTYSCYKGGDVHCGRCGTCFERREAFKLANVADPTKYANYQEEFEEMASRAQYVVEARDPTKELALRYKEFYNKDRGLPEPVWGERADGLQCPNCGSQEMYFSGSPDDPEEILGETVRCGHCGRITDWYEACK